MFRDDDDDEIYEDDILEEIPVGEGEPVLEDDDEEVIILQGIHFLQLILTFSTILKNKSTI